ncbi:tRNA (adenine-N1)-methyltransferase [Desulfovibrio ferrophilus]|uniref:tRNA (adenine(58)-N(1))-methyltransferase TrmI n=1 Tax=Desulfovibrio ferrophilus TaxID=241368 RepID=A0A2Z6B054_9BACT|nr:tRNA (adenine-N1)-methyltransferase [Desulfovibrio ferrophilus]BBD08825.1 tRNA (adenine-N(1)-)-methyltransferase [Desulfovibrio ferrophilus]
MPNPGQLVMLISPKGKRYVRVFDPKDQLHCNEGVIEMSAIAEAGYGGIAITHMNKAFRIVRPTMYDLIKYGIKRQTQILYPKEIGYILVKLGIGSGSRVIEAGSGSGGLTVALSHVTGETGKVYTYERRPEFAALVRKNLDRCGLGKNVEQFEGDVIEGFEQDDADALFLDVRDPWNHVHNVANAVRPGAPVCFLAPVTNQVSRLLEAMETAPFDDIEVVEILVRRWKPIPDRLRPEDRMVAHTGFLIFARQQDPLEPGQRAMGTRERKQEAARREREAQRAAKEAKEAKETEAQDGEE